jgi:hypothetical protein
MAKAVVFKQFSNIFWKELLTIHVQERYDIQHDNTQHNNNQNNHNHIKGLTCDTQNT